MKFYSVKLLLEGFQTNQISIHSQTLKVQEALHFFVLPSVHRILQGRHYHPHVENYEAKFQWQDGVIKYFLTPPFSCKYPIKCKQNENQYTISFFMKIYLWCNPQYRQNAYRGKITDIVRGRSQGLKTHKKATKTKTPITLKVTAKEVDLPEACIRDCLVIMATLGRQMLCLHRSQECHFWRNGMKTGNERWN